MVGESADDRAVVPFVQTRSMTGVYVCIWMCKCICICVCIYIYIQICIYVFKYIYVYIYICMCVYDIYSRVHTVIDVDFRNGNLFIIKCCPVEIKYSRKSFWLRTSTPQAPQCAHRARKYDRKETNRHAPKNRRYSKQKFGKPSFLNLRKINSMIQAFWFLRLLKRRKSGIWKNQDHSHGLDQLLLGIGNQIFIKWSLREINFKTTEVVCGWNSFCYFIPIIENVEIHVKKACGALFKNHVN